MQITRRKKIKITRRKKTRPKYKIGQTLISKSDLSKNIVKGTIKKIFFDNFIGTNFYTFNENDGRWGEGILDQFFTEVHND